MSKLSVGPTKPFAQLALTLYLTPRFGMSGAIPALSPFASFNPHNTFAFLSKLRISANTPEFSLYEVLYICATRMIILTHCNSVEYKSPISWPSP
jgi:hypothetical protein